MAFRLPVMNVSIFILFIYYGSMSLTARHVPPSKLLAKPCLRLLSSL